MHTPHYRTVSAGEVLGAPSISPPTQRVEGASNQIVKERGDWALPAADEEEIRPPLTYVKRCV